VELAFVLPVLLLLLFAILDFGKVLNYWNDENDLANVAARYAAVGKNPGLPSQSLADYIKSKADSAELRAGSGTDAGIQGTGAQVCIAYVDSTGASVTSPSFGDTVTVTVSSNYKWLPIVGSAIGTTLAKTITGKAQMRVEVVAPAADANISGCSS